MRSSPHILVTVFMAALFLGTIPMAVAHTGSLVALTAVDRDSGRELAEAPIIGRDGRTYVAGVPGHRYALKLRNLTGERVMAVLSVDGVNVISGQTAGANQTGYVLSPYQIVDIDGWRKSDTQTAAFLFTALSDSYAARTGRPGQVGIIGVAVFPERPPVRVMRREAGDMAAAAPSMETARQDAGAPRVAAADTMAKSENGGRAKSADERLGTGHGEREWSPIERTEFERASTIPAETVLIEYDSRAHLMTRGILPRPPMQPREPQAFPADGYVPDPPHSR